MDIEGVITELRNEGNRINAAISALEQMRTPTNGASRSATRAYTKHSLAAPVKRRPMSASARRKISQAQKARWAASRKASA